MPTQTTKFDAQGATVAYVMKAFPRTSETFITNEVALLEEQGLPLAVFSIKQLEGQKQHGAVGRITAPIHYLPATTPFEESHFLTWLYRNLPSFVRSHWHLLRHRAIAWVSTLLEAMWMCLKYRKGVFAWPRKVFFKEFLQAGYIAEQVLAAPTIRHLHAHFAHGSTTVAMFASRLTGLPFSFTAHAKDIYLAELNPGNLLATKMRRARFVVTCTEANKQYLEQYNRAALTPIHVIYHGLDTSLFHPSSLPVAPAKPLILSVGRMVEKKGFTYLIEACHQLKEQGYDFACRIVGGEDKHTSVIQALIQQLQLSDCVTLQHAVTQEELAQIYAQATVFALPCQIIDNGDRDGIPNVLVEAMAMRLPVVSTNISGIPELVENGINGLLVEQKDATALARAISELLDQPGRRARLGAAARETVCGLFDSSANTTRLKTLFVKALGQQESQEDVPDKIATATAHQRL